MNKCPDGIKSDDWLEVRVSLGLFVSQLRGTDLHYHNIIGNNKDALMHVFGMAPMAFGAMMLTAGVLKLRKAPGGGDDDKILSINKGHWEAIMADAKIDDTGKMTTYGNDKTIVVSIGTMNPIRAERANESRFRKNDIMTAEQQFSSTPPIPPPRRNSFNLRVKFQQAVAPHIMGGYELLHWQANRSILEQGKKFAVAIGSDEACARYNDDNDDANDEESSTMTDAAVLEDDADDEDYNPADDEHIDSALDDEAEKEFLEQYEEEHRITDESPVEGPVEFHLLKRFGIDPNNEKEGDRDKMKKIIGEIWRANSMFAKNEGKKKPTSISFSHHKTSWKGELVLVPKVDYANPAAGDKLFQRKTKDLGNIEELLLQVAGGKKEDKTHAARSIGTCLWRRYEKEMCEAADERGLASVVKERFSTEKTAALIADMGINFGQARILSRYLKDHFEYSVLASEPEVYSLGLGYVEPKWGEYEYKKNGKVMEVCHFWVRDVKEVIMKITEHQFSGRGNEWRKIVRVGVVVGGDHGQGAFRVVLKIGYFYDQKEKKPPIIATVKVAHVECKKEDSEILRHTVVQDLGEYLNSIDGWGLEYKNHSQSFSWVEIDRAKRSSKLFTEVTQFSTGDISFLFLILGRVGPHFWCLVCDLHKDEYQKEGHARGCDWTLERLQDLSERHERGDFRGREADALSARNAPLLPSIPLKHTGLSRLHRMLGHGNNTVGPEGVLIRTIENKIVQYSEKEKEVRLELSTIDGVMSAAKAEKSTWDANTRAERGRKEASHRNKLLELEVLETTVAGNDDGAPNAQQKIYLDALKKEIKDLDDSIKVHKFDEKKLDEKIKKCEDEKTKLKTKLKAFHRKRKIDDDGVFQKMEKVLHKYQIYRGAYHGGDFQGPHLRRHMENAKEIFDEYLPIIKAANRPEGPERVMSDDDIDAFCKECVELLQTIDAINANLMEWYYDVNDEETKRALQELKDLNEGALKLVRKLEMSVTPKWTLQEDHVHDHHYWLIEEGYGGERWLDESYVEHEHQVGVKEDRRTQAMRSFKSKQSAQMKSVHRSSNRDVQEASVERKRKPKRRTGAQTSKKQKIKDEYRKALSAPNAPESGEDSE